jgi:hypothetical protein
MTNKIIIANIIFFTLLSLIISAAPKYSFEQPHDQSSLLDSTDYLINSQVKKTWLNREIFLSCRTEGRHLVSFKKISRPFAPRNDKLFQIPLALRQAPGFNGEP